MHLDTLWTNARLATMAPVSPGIGTIDQGAIGSRDGQIAFVGPIADLPVNLQADRVVDCEGRWVTPGLIDCHTHLVFAGDRAREFELRLEGASYEDIAETGGGIAATVAMTREASEKELVAASLPRLDTLIDEGVTTVEIKSGYGLSKESEIRMLRAARSLGRRREIDIVTTFLGAHALPVEANGDSGAYIDAICDTMLPAVVEEGLADAVDAFCEGIAFSPGEVARVFAAARSFGLPVRLHADQLSNLHGARLAAESGALSADHLEFTDEDGAMAIAEAGTVAVVLPGAFYTLRQDRAPPIETFRRHGAPIAIATDCNPGSSPLTSLLLAMNMAATLFGLTVEECLIGVTRHAAQALGRGDRIGTIEIGKQCDLAIWDIDRPAELVYRIGFNPLHQRVVRGR